MGLEIPDPRVYGVSTDVNELARCQDDGALRGRLRELLDRGNDAEITAALRAAPSHAQYVRLWQAVCDTAHHIGEKQDAAIVARVFALPLVIITGSRAPANLPGVLRDIGAVTQLFEQHGALGATRNFGLGNALCSLQTVEAITPGEIYAWSRELGSAGRELAPSDIAIHLPGEEVHLRYLVGAGIAPAAEASFVETASNIGAWGMPLTRMLAAQLAHPGVEVLPLARPPLDLLRAAHAGRHAQLDAAFNLFVSNAVRRLRSASGDPDAVISAHDDGDVRISLSSQFDDTAHEGFRWPLHPLDDLAEVTAAVAELLAACRIRNVSCVEKVLPALDDRGQPWFARPRDVEKFASGVRPH